METDPKDNEHQASTDMMRPLAARYPVGGM